MATPHAATPRLHGFIGEAVQFLSHLDELPSLDRSVVLTGRRAFVVENDAEVCTAISDELRAAGFLVESTGNSSNAIAQLANQRCDLILLDADLPELSGFELCGCLRGMEIHAVTPIVIVTDGDTDAGQLEDVAFIPKPFLPEELALRIVVELIKAQLEPA